MKTEGMSFKTFAIFMLIVIASLIGYGEYKEYQIRLHTPKYARNSCIECSW